MYSSMSLGIIKYITWKVYHDFLLVELWDFNQPPVISEGYSLIDSNIFT